MLCPVREGTRLLRWSQSERAHPREGVGISPAGFRQVFRTYRCHSEGSGAGDRQSGRIGSGRRMPAGGVLRHGRLQRREFLLDAGGEFWDILLDAGNCGGTCGSALEGILHVVHRTADQRPGSTAGRFGEPGCCSGGVGCGN
uniref:(northern house mosquito) hypothetical protein n=1 Tax=Culex pipiens TaxID=7175 RepID=A0A8D8EZG9_CULPI